MTISWKSLQSSSLLRKRAKLLAEIRAYFAAQSVIEVDVPLIGVSTVTDPYLNALTVELNSRPHYLQTSPEFFMKRLIAQIGESIYYLGKAFREDESGIRHNPEFTMLEWYRMGFDDHKLIDDVFRLASQLKPDLTTEKLSYRLVFQKYLNIDPHLADADELAALAKQHVSVSWQNEDKNTWLDLIFSHVIEPNLQNFTVVYDYPASQCALAKITKDELGMDVARRFEVFYRGIELANGYWELTDAGVQRNRFNDDLQNRRARQLAEPKIDEKLIAALENGLPECAGVALGVDRLFMCLEELESINEAMSFPYPRL